jgi:hypothetical protein
MRSRNSRYSTHNSSQSGVHNSCSRCYRCPPKHVTLDSLPTLAATTPLSCGSQAPERLRLAWQTQVAWLTHTSSVRVFPIGGTTESLPSPRFCLEACTPARYHSPVAQVLSVCRSRRRTRSPRRPEVDSTSGCSACLHSRHSGRIHDDPIRRSRHTGEQDAE